MKIEWNKFVMNLVFVAVVLGIALIVSVPVHLHYVDFANQNLCEEKFGDGWDYDHNMGFGNQRTCPKTTYDDIACYNTVIQDDGTYETQCKVIER